MGFGDFEFRAFRDSGLGPEFGVMIAGLRPLRISWKPRGSGSLVALALDRRPEVWKGRSLNQGPFGAVLFWVNKSGR